MSGVDTLVEMGFLRNRAEKAWHIMGERGGVQAAMEWLLEHNEDPDIDVPYKPPDGHVLGKSDGSDTAKPAQQELNSFDETNAASHESAATFETAALTPEEKAEQLKRYFGLLPNTLVLLVFTSQFVHDRA